MSFEKVMKLKVISGDSELEDDEALEEFLVNFLNDEFYKDALTFERVIDEMTEKRFTVHINWFNKEKTEGEALLKDNGQPLLVTERIDDARLLKNILNELYGENKQLKHKLSQQEMEYATTACRQAEENEELKDRIDNYNTAFKKLQDLTERKINENEQLKEDNDYLEKRFKEEEWHYDHIDEDRDAWKHKCQELEKKNGELKKGMIGVVDRYIKNVECNPPSSARTYRKIKGALINIREDLRNLIGALE